MDASNIVAACSACLPASARPTRSTRCDCTSVVDTCDAEVVARGSSSRSKPIKQQCARVDYFVDGQPFVSVVVDGEDRQNWLARTTNPTIIVQSCQVCRDTARRGRRCARARRGTAAAGRTRAAQTATGFSR